MSVDPGQVGVRTSRTHPLIISGITAPQGGQLGMSMCPGIQGMHYQGSFRWVRDLEADLRLVSAWRPDIWIGLMEPPEYEHWKVLGLPLAAASQCSFFVMPVRELHAPGHRFASRWGLHGPHIADCLKHGARVLVQGVAGVGRTGTVAAQLLIECGVSAESALAMVRRSRPGAVETSSQEAYLKKLAPYAVAAR